MIWCSIIIVYNDHKIMQQTAPHTKQPTNKTFFAFFETPVSYILCFGHIPSYGTATYKVSDKSILYKSSRGTTAKTLAPTRPYNYYCFFGIYYYKPSRGTVEPRLTVTQ